MYFTLTLYLLFCIQLLSIPSHLSACTSMHTLQATNMPPVGIHKRIMHKLTVPAKVRSLSHSLCALLKGVMAQTLAARQCWPPLTDTLADMCSHRRVQAATGSPGNLMQSRGYPHAVTLCLQRATSVDVNTYLDNRFEHCDIIHDTSKQLAITEARLTEVLHQFNQLKSRNIMVEEQLAMTTSDLIEFKQSYMLMVSHSLQPLA